MALLSPSLSILDEIDSGLDIDSLNIVTKGINHVLKDGFNSSQTPRKAILLITHWKRMLDQVIPNKIHVLKDGKIIKVGGKELALKLEEKGYNWTEENEQ
jgi:Fe-S cluster assembly ATP-binding protein